MPKLNVNMLALVFLFIDNEKTSRKSYNNRDKIAFIETVFYEIKIISIISI